MAIDAAATTVAKSGCPLIRTRIASSSGQKWLSRRQIPTTPNTTNLYHSHWFASMLARLSAS